LLIHLLLTICMKKIMNLLAVVEVTAHMFFVFIIKHFIIKYFVLIVYLSQ